MCVPTLSEFPPKDLVDFVRENQAVAFVGSGLSLEHYPSWPRLIESLTNQCCPGRYNQNDFENPTADQLMALAEEAMTTDPAAYCRALLTTFSRKPFEVPPQYQALV